MSVATDELSIDPALRDLSSLPSPVAKKRKTRNSAGNDSLVAAGTTSVAGVRSTRRSAASTSASNKVPTGAAASINESVGNVGASAGSAEPTRGEEENLNGYHGVGGGKRPRLSPPVGSKRATPSTSRRGSADEGTFNRFYPSDQSARSQGQAQAEDQDRPVAGAGFALTSDPSASALDGIEELAAAAIAANNSSHAEPSSKTNTHTQTQLQSQYSFKYTPIYPIGLTPFVYPCLTPHLPGPSPGGPHNPNFRRFEPYPAIKAAATRPGTTTATTTSAAAAEGSKRASPTQSLSVPKSGTLGVGPSASVPLPETLAQHVDRTSSNGLRLDHDPNGQLPSDTRTAGNTTRDQVGKGGAALVMGTKTDSDSALPGREGTILGNAELNHRTIIGEEKHNENPTQNQSTDANANANAEAEANAAYESLSALLSASQGEFSFDMTNMNAHDVGEM